MTTDRATDPTYVFGSPEASACPYPLYSRARESHIHELPGFGHLVASYDDVVTAARQYSSFSSHRAPVGAGDPEIQAIADTGYPMGPGMVTSDPPEHSRYRRLLQRSFTSGAIAKRESMMQQILEDLVDDFAPAGRVELYEQFALPFPTRVTGQLLGISMEDQEHFASWANAIAETSSPYITHERAVECMKRLVEMQHHFVREIEVRRGDPRDDLLTEIITAVGEGDRPFDLSELLEMVRLLVSGGTETTASLIVSAMYLLLTHPEQFDAVQNDHSLIPQALDEALRYESPVQWVPRIVENHDVSFNDVPLPVGSRVLLGWGSANRDPARFGETADEFDIFRKRSSHVAFGHAHHMCIGAPLARVEARMAFEILLTRLDSIRLADPEAVEYVGRGFLRGLPSLDIVFNAK